MKIILNKWDGIQMGWLIQSHFLSTLLLVNNQPSTKKKKKNTYYDVLTWKVEHYANVWTYYAPYHKITYISP